MFDKDSILTCAEGLVGFREDNNAIYDALYDGQYLSPIQESSSGLWFNDLSGLTFEMISANLSNDIDAKTYLNNVYESEVLSLVNQFVLKSKQNYESKELLSYKSITEGVASMNDRVTQNQRFVGYWIRPHRSDYLKMRIPQLGFQVVDNTLQTTPLKIYLYETSQLEPIATFDFPMEKKFSLVWKDVTNFLLYYQSLSGGTGQDFLLGYYEKDLDNPQPFQLQSQALYLNFSCGCSGDPKEIYGKYVGIEPIEINKQYLNWNGTEYMIPQVDNVGDFVSSQTYGLTAKISVYCDITDLLCQNIGMFARSLQHAVASRILYDSYASTRINYISDAKREQAKQFAIKYDGVLNGYTTADGRVKGLIDTLTVDFSGLDHYCLRCKDGIKTGHLFR